MVRIGLLGGVSAATDGGEPVDVGSAKSRTVLAVLALSAGSAVPVPRLVELGWGAQPPRTAGKTLQTYIVGLRRALGPDAIVRTGAAYRLVVDADAVDVARFRRHLESGDMAAALAEWTGAPLAGLDAHGLTAVVDGLVEQWLGAVEVDLERRVNTDAAAAIAPLTELTANHPFHEGLWALLMTALYRVGRQADALAAFRSARAHLVEQLGVEPGPHLRELESLILGQDGQLGAAPAEGSRRGNLPLRRGRLIGRDDDLDAVAKALATSSVVTLVGPGGIGKTRLALAVAARMSAVDRGSAAWFVDLAGIASSEDVPRAVADVLRVTEGSGRTLTLSIVAALPGRALVVLDNCEHVVDGAAELAGAVAERCPGVRVLATSREALGVDDEQLVEVPPLHPAGPAAELFAERARAVSPSFDPRAHREEVEEICRRLDGIPLAIELAAARTRTLAPPDLVARLGDRLRLLTGGRRTAAARHRTLRATIEWSYELLTPPQQSLFRRLSIFSGPFDGAAAATIGADVDVDDVLGELVGRSMVVAGSGPFGRRFRLLETMRAFAAEQLAQDGGSDVVAGRHAQWCLDQVAAIHELLAGPAEVDGVARLVELWPNLRGAVDRACHAGDHGSAGALVRPVITELNLRRQSEIGDWAERILAITPVDDGDRIGYWLACATHRAMQRGDHGGYDRLVHRFGEPDHALLRFARIQLRGDGEALVASTAPAVAWLRRRGEDHAAALVEIGGAAGLLSTGRFSELDASVSALADRYRDQGPPTLLYVALTLLGYSAFFQGDPDRAERLFDESAGIAVPDRTISVNEPVEARAAFRRGNRTRAFAILRSHVEELLRTDHTDIAGNAAVEFITMMAAIDRLPDAARVLRYLAATGDFGAVASRTLVADADRIAAAVPDSLPQLDAHQALEYMRDVLAGLDESSPGT